MKSMTEPQAEAYIFAGLFPPNDEQHIGDICDLQDIFGHQSMEFIYGTLAHEDICENAERLYRLIWDQERVNRYVDTANKISKAREAIFEAYDVLRFYNMESEVAELWQE